MKVYIFNTIYFWVLGIHVFRTISGASHYLKDASHHVVLNGMLLVPGILAGLETATSIW